MSAFVDILKEARERAGLTQAALARAIGVSVATVASWEIGRRRPGFADRGRDGRQLVIEAADVLGLDAGQLNEMLDDLGLSRVPAGRLVPLLDRRKPIAVIQAECASYPWPTLAMNEDFEAVAWNEAANDLSELDFATDLSEPGARHLLRMALSEHYRDKLLNWDEVIAVMVGMWKTTGTDILSPGGTTPYFQNLLGYVLAHHGAEMGRLLRIWEDTPPHVEGRRGEFDVDWRTSDGTSLHFHNQLTAWSDFDGTNAFDWHPADAATWDWLDERREARLATTGPDEPNVADRPGRSTARELLRFARERNGLSRRELSERGGLSEGLIYGIETGTRPMHRETLVRLSQAMALDPTSLNTILEAAGHDPEPSQLTAYLLGYGVGDDPRYAGNLGQRVSWTPAAVEDEVARYRWPALVVNERCEVLAANDSIARVLGLDFNRLPPGPARNLFAIVTDAPFRLAARNWETAVANVLPGNLDAYMAPPGGHRRPGKDADYFDSVIRHVREREAAEGRGDGVIHELFSAWRANPSRRLTARVAFPLEWSAGGQPMRFNTVITPWSAMIDPYWAIDLHPADGATWRELGRGLYTNV